MKRFLKLTGGSYSGRKLYVPASGVRPATNLVREAVFSTMRAFFEDGVKGLNVLDLFAGSGALGLEALSRGAASATFVDSGGESIKSIRKNLNLLGLSGVVVPSDAVAFLRKSRRLEADLVFMDPPYRYSRSGEVVELLTKALMKRSLTVLIYERFFDKELPAFGNMVYLLKRKKYGQSELLYYRIEVNG